MNIIEISEIKIQFPEAQSKNFSCLIQQLVLPSRQETPLKTQTRDARGKSKPLVWGTAERNGHKIPQMGWTRAPQWFPLSWEQPLRSQPGRWSTGKLNTCGAGRGLRDFGEKWRESLLLPKRSKTDLLGAPTFICWKDIKEIHPAGKGYNVWKMTGIWEAAEAQECQS